MLSTPSDRYRPDIDGLRAIAVMLVVGFHAFPEAMPGGFIGVDIFFVISGFLITGLIVRDLDQQRFSLVAFYNRRIRRIFPALIVVLVVTLVLGWLWMLPAAYAQLSSDVFASAAFFANIALLLQSGYFDIESGKKPLLHLWSLGIEEQFYLFWPLILMLVARLRLNMLAAASVIGLLSFILNVALIGSNPVATFYLPFTRAWELLAGAALACSWSQVSQETRPSNLYLWHWPLFVFLAIIKFAPLTLLERGLIVGLSFVLAWLTYRFVEIPFRFGRPSPLKIAGLCAAMVLVAAAGGVVVEGRGFDFRLPAEIRAMTDVPEQTSQWRVHECMLDLSHELSFAESCAERDRRPLVLVWGDSTAGALLPGLRQAQQTHDFGLAQFTSSSCVPALNTDVAGTPNCRAINDKILALARELKPDIVLLHSTWDRYLDGVAATVAALKKETNARVIVLGSVPWWKRGLPNEVLRYFMLHHRLIPERSSRAAADGSGAALRDRLVPLGAEFISVWDVMCNADGCLTRIGDTAGDLSASDQVHLTEKGSVFLIQSIIDEVLRGRTPRSSNATQ
jgi:peptidoglycan/LPS O-acetylase OafA/YrhL